MQRNRQNKNHSQLLPGYIYPRNRVLHHVARVAMGWMVEILSKLNKPIDELASVGFRLSVERFFQQQIQSGSVVQ